VAATASSEEPEQRQPASTPDRSADFLFGRPKASIGIRGSWVFAAAGSDIFDFVTRHLTLDKKDFDSPGFAVDVGFAITPRTDIQVGLELNRVSRQSEYRDYVDNLFEPIQQTTTLNATHIVGSVRYALMPKGREVGRLAWIPSRWVPYAGAGAGVIYWQFKQNGDFVDFQDLSVFGDAFRSDGWTPTMHVYGGVDVKLYRALYGTVQARYTKASGGLSSDFIDFDPIDLSGFRLSAGINVLF
jgi:hypothetical protein